MDQDNHNVFIENTNNNGTPPKQEIIICGRCGAEMKKDSRYCMKCGNLNYEHKENAFMKQYAIDNIKQGDYIEGIETAKNNGMEVPKEVVNHPYKACLITNIILYAIPLVLLIVAYVFLGDKLDVNLTGIMIGGVIAYVIMFIEAYAYQRMVIKAGEKWWSYFIPFYNMYVFFKISFRKGWMFLLTIIPVVGMIVAFVGLYKLGKKFYKSGWLMLFFPWIMIPVIGFDKEADYCFEELKPLKSLEPVKLDSKGRSKKERSYRAKEAFMTVIVLVGFVAFIFLGWDYIVDAWEFVVEQFEEVKKIFLQS